MGVCVYVWDQSSSFLKPFPFFLDSLQLCDACLAPSSDNDGTGCDNMTCIIVLLQSPSEFLQNEL